MKCPVCELTTSDDAEFCPRCGWELKDWLLQISDNRKIKYYKRMEIAKQNWQTMQELKNQASSLSDTEKERSWREPVTNMQFVYVPGGIFMMGDNFKEGNKNEIPVHEVQVDGFYMGKYPVTQGEWKKVMERNPSYFDKGDDFPAEQVSWDEVQEFIQKLKEFTKGEHRFRLPTEAEWEYAARSGGKIERYAGGEDIDALAWYGKNSGGSTHPVGQKTPNSLQIYDMSGNVWEWCQDVYNETAYQKHQRNNPLYTDSNRFHRIIRGGSWGDPPKSLRCAARGSFMPGNRFDSLGFRLVKE